METLATKIAFSEKAEKEFSLTEEALRLVSEQIIDQAINTNTYLVVADKNGQIIEIPAKDLKEKRDAAKG